MILEYLQNIPSQLATVIIAVLPIFELRGAIPVAIGVYKMSVMNAYIWAVIGNMIPAFFLVLFLEGVSKRLMASSKAMNKFFNWLFDRTRRKFTHKYDKYGAAALILFVAIPLPVTGVWTASVASFLFGIKPRIAVPYMLAGVIIAGVIVSILSAGLIN